MPSRRLSVQDVWHDRNLESQEHLISSPSDDSQYQIAKGTDPGQFDQLFKGAQQQRSKQKRSAPVLNRSRSNLRMTKMLKPTTRETVYNNFDVLTFGERQAPPLVHRKSSLALELLPSEILIEEEDVDEEEAAKRLATIVWNSRSATASCSKTGSPKDECVRRDLGYDPTSCSGLSTVPCSGQESQPSMELEHSDFDFGQKTCVW